MTGGCGFIGSAFVRLALARGAEVVNLDKLTYAGNPANLADVADDEAYRFVHADIADAAAVTEAIEGVDAVVNLAAESHVDRSILDPADFIRTDVVGTAVLLDAARRAGVRRFVQVSTDEVYGSIPTGAFRETDPISPSSPYSASKAGGDLQVLAWHRTFGLDAVITRGSNTYGPRQYPEKLIPLFVTNALDGLPLPVYGDGMQVRDWIHVDDHCAGIWTAMERRRRRRGLQRRRRQRAAEHGDHAPRPRAHRARRLADAPRRGPPRPRPPLRPRHRAAAGARLGAAHRRSTRAWPRRWSGTGTGATGGSRSRAASTAVLRGAVRGPLGVRPEWRRRRARDPVAAPGSRASSRAPAR